MDFLALARFLDNLLVEIAGSLFRRHSLFALKRLYIGQILLSIMDAYRIFIEYKNGDLPGIKHIRRAVKKKDVYLLELIALMRTRTPGAEPISEDEITAEQKDSFKEKFNEMVLSSRIIQRMFPDFRGNYRNTKKDLGAITEELTEDTQSIVSASTDTSRSTTSEIKGTLSSSSTIPMGPGSSGGASKEQVFDPKKKFNYEMACNRHFMNRSMSRIKKLAKICKAEANTKWPVCAASKVYVKNEKLNDPSLSRYFKFLDNSDRFCHMIGDVEHFIIALNDDKFKTFAFGNRFEDTLQIGESMFNINLIQIRKSLKTLISSKMGDNIDNTLSIDTLAIHDNPNKDVVNFTILLCSIGLPVFQMFSIEDLLKSWRKLRFRKFTSRNVLRTIGHILYTEEIFMGEVYNSKTEAQLFLNQYDRDLFVNDDDVSDSTRPETFFFHMWYHYPTKNQFKFLANMADDIRDECVTNN